jgi:hypothetical protein
MEDNSMVALSAAGVSLCKHTQQALQVVQRSQLTSQCWSVILLLVSHAGVCMNPRCHLRLVYEANPLALLCEQAGGIASDGKQRICEITPSKLHQRLPLFMGSLDDMRELMSYDDVQQLDGKTYTV